MRSWRLSVLAALLIPIPLPAQTVMGRVFEQGDAPVRGAGVTLVAEGAVVARAETDTAGLFRMHAGRPGEYRVRVEHIAYTTVESDAITVGTGETVTVEIRLGTAAIPLRPITVTARSADPRHTAFHERRLSRRQGAFITRAEIDRVPHARTTDLLRNVSGITILSSHEAGRSSLRGNLISIRGGGGMCEPAIYVDGVRVIQRVQSNMDDVLPPSMIEGIEIYTSSAAAPAGFGGQGNTCGVLLFWTRVGRTAEERHGARWTHVLLGAGLLGALFFIAQ